MWIQKTITISPRSRGFHIITNDVLGQFLEINNIYMGLLHIFIQHTSASLTVNENADPTVREDFESHFNMLAPENQSYYKHTYEGSDDMPAHLKTSILGSSLSIPITKGKLNLGTWQGIYLCEHRNHSSARKLLVTAHGDNL